MDKRFELAEALMELSKASERVAKLILQINIGEIGSDTILTALGNSTESINVDSVSGWPHTPLGVTGLDISLNNLTVLEFHRGPNKPITQYHHHAKQIDLITDSYQFAEQPKNIRIISHKECEKRYDVGVIWESLEFTDNPSNILALFKKHCRKIFIRFRPWTSRNGAFLCDKAFAHLAMNTDNQVQFKVVRPLATYETLIKSLDLSTDERRVNISQLDQFFIANEQLVRIIRERTWGKIDYEQAIKIMTIDSVDYVLSTPDIK